MYYKQTDESIVCLFAVTANKAHWWQTGTHAVGWDYGLSKKLYTPCCRPCLPANLRWMLPHKYHLIRAIPKQVTVLSPKQNRPRNHGFACKVLFPLTCQNMAQITFAATNIRFWQVSENCTHTAKIIILMPMQQVYMDYFHILFVCLYHTYI